MDTNDPEKFDEMLLEGEKMYEDDQYRVEFFLMCVVDLKIGG